MKGWTHYEGECDVEDLVAAIKECGTRIGMESRCDRPSSNEYAIRSIQQRHWLAVIWFGLPQDVRWIVRSSDSRTSLFCDRRCLPWARNLALCLCFASPLFLWMSSFGANGQWETEHPLIFPFRCVLLMQFAGSVWLCFHLFFGGNRFYNYWEEILARTETTSGFLEEQPTASFNRRSLWQIAYLGYVFVVAVTYGIISWPTSATPILSMWINALLLLLIFAGFLLCGLLPALLKNQGNSRSQSILPGLYSLFAIVVWGLVILPIYIVAEEANGIQDAMALRQIFDSNPDVMYSAVANPDELSSAKDSGQLDLMYAGIRWWCIMSVAFGVFLAGFAMGFLQHGISIAAIVQRNLIRVKTHGDSPLAFRTATGGRLLPWLRYCVGGVATLFGTLALLGTWNSFAIGTFAWCNAIIPSYPEDITRVVDGSYTIMCGMLLQPATTEYLYLGVISRVFWMIYGLALPSLLALSVGSLIWSRQRLRRRLLENELIGFTEHDRILRRVDALAKRAGVRGPRISVTPTKSCSLLSHTFGILRREHWIELSDGFLTLFNGDRKNTSLSAALAHEMAHQRLGHCLRNNILRCVARTLFIGDGFVLSLVDSYQNELKADQVAVREFQVDPVDLRKALWLVSDCMSAEVVTSKTALTGIEFVPSQHTLYDRFLRDGPQGLSFLERWKVYIVCFLGSYTGGDRLSYWHPHPDERIKRLRLLEE
ncbi:MAG: hypothetical protein IID44_20885 [Planctomycetes bacterium]|nr:hypothetical protein [Planctomycetota bacterium]